MLMMKVNGPRYKWASGVIIWTIAFFSPLYFQKTFATSGHLYYCIVVRIHFIFTFYLKIKIILRI